MDVTQVVNWARSQADSIDAQTRWEPEANGYGGYWTATSEQSAGQMMAAASAAIAVLTDYAGRDSAWAMRADEAVRREGETPGAHAREVAGVLREWANHVEQGLARVPRIEEPAHGSVAADDLMAQVHQLNEDNDAHPAAAVVLAAAALELRVRSTVAGRGLELQERPSLMAYCRRLRQDEVISAQDVKEFDVVAGLRNDAAHGHFERLSRERAGLMEQQVVLLLRRLDDLDRVGERSLS